MGYAHGVNRRRWIYPLAALLTAAAVLLADRLVLRPVEKRRLPTVRYTGPLEMRPAPRPPPPPAAPAAPAEPAGPATPEGTPSR
jgi:hypothetical protein